MPITEKPTPATRNAYQALVARVGIVTARQMVSDEIRARRTMGQGTGARTRHSGTPRGPSRNRKLSDADLATIKRSLRDGLTLAEVARQMWKDKGFSSFESAYNCMRTALRTRG